jgi:hypothetical protein
MADPKPNAESMRELFAGLDQIHIVCIHPNGLKITGKEFGQHIDNAVDYCVAQNSAGINIYWSVNRVRDNLHAKAGKRDVVAARFCQVDIDPPKNGGAFDKGAIVEGLAGIETPPSFIIDSGGGLNAFWRLDEPCQNLASIEYINQQIRDYCDADHCWNSDRVMRLPGSVNWPDAKKRARGRVPSLAKFAMPDTGEIYEPHILSAAFPPAKVSGGNATEGVAVTMPANVEPLTPDNLGLSALDPIRMAISEPPGRDRSGDGVAAARLMANAGYSDEQIVGVLLNPANAVAAHYMGQRDPKRAATRTLQLVRADSPAEAEPVPVMSQADFDAFVSNMKAKAQAEVRADMAPHMLESEHIAQTCKENAETLTHSHSTDWLDDLGDNPIGQFVRFVCSTALRPQPFITLGAALTVFGTAAGRRYAGPTDLRTNLYAIGICDSGGGKDHPIKRATELMIQAGQQKKMGGSKIASGQAMITDLTNNPALMYAIDEVGFLIASAADRKRAPKHATEIIDNLTAFYSQANSTFLGTSYADQSEQGGKPRKVIEQPCLSLFGVTTPSVFWGSLTSSNVMDGSLARMVIFQSENDYPDPQYDVARREIPATLVMAIQRIVAGAEGHQALPMGEGAVQAPKPYVVAYADDEARFYYRAMQDEQTRMLRDHQGTSQTSIIARLAENAAKIALIRAIAGNPAAPVLTVADLKWGNRVARQSVDSLLRAVKQSVADNEQEAKLKRLHAMIAKAGARGIEHKELSLQSRFMGSKRQLNDALDFLIEGGSINVAEVQRTDGKQGKGKRVYFDLG